MPLGRSTVLLVYATPAALIVFTALIFSATLASIIAAAVANAAAIHACRRWVGPNRTPALFAGMCLLGFALSGGNWLVAAALPPLFLASFVVSALLVSNAAVRTLICSILLLISLSILGPASLLNELLIAVVVSIAGTLTIQSFKPLIPTPAQLIVGAIYVLIASAITAGSVPLASLAGAMIVLYLAFFALYHLDFDDFIVFVDKDHKPISTARRSEAHHSDTQLHLAFSVFIFNSAGELLLQRRAKTKKTWPGVWSNSCCGHQMLYESPQAAAKRRVRFELGLSGVKLQMMMPDFKYRAEKDGIVENEVCPVLVGFTEKIPRPNPNEIGEIRWVDWHMFVSEVDSPELGISPWAVEEVRLLASNQVFRELLNRNTNVQPGISRPLTESGTL